MVSIGDSDSKRVLPFYRPSVVNCLHRYCSRRSVSGLPTDCVLSCFVGVSLHVSLRGHYGCKNVCVSMAESIEYSHHTICGKTVEGMVVRSGDVDLFYGLHSVQVKIFIVYVSCMQPV